jgi:hypothetical protein
VTGRSAGQMSSVFTLVIPEGPTSWSSSSCDSYSSSPESRSTSRGSGIKSSLRRRRRESSHLNMMFADLSPQARRGHTAAAGPSRSEPTRPRTSLRS